MMKHKLKILVVDDDPILLEQTESLLSPTYDVSLAISGKLALDYLEEGNRPDLILLDILMPDPDGYETLARIQSISGCKEIPVIFLTGILSPEHEVKCLESGALDYITKPFSSAVLLARISLALKNMNRSFIGYELDESKIGDLREPLTASETKVLRLMVRAYNNKEIAKELNYSYDYVKKLASQVMGKLGIKNRSEIKKFRK
ncbi:MAG: DNA-binding response regulator [Peptostreptococcaceae bacterium]|nr:DNA-binding response regulator [Peptostreptococcaceae bacterium]